jgi:hypothetical protein
MKDEALKLAFALDYWATQTDMGRKPDPKSLIRRASAELRRLQAELDAIKQALALDKKAENARELGLDYEPAPVQEPVACVACEGNPKWGNIPCAVCGATPTAQPAPVQEPVAVIGSGFQLLYCREDWAKGLKIGDTLCLCTPPAAQPAPVQEPVAYLFTNVQSGDIEASTNPDHKEGEREMWYREPLVRPPAAKRPWIGLTDEDKLTVRRMPWETLGDLMDNTEAKLKQKNAAAQPAVPDAMTSADIQEHIEYVAGWNDCRAEMLKGNTP